ncbi:MAG: outer membrane beta-barrel protein [Woeseiaceae bacterium]|nr:outer membrane beta-barrel protein [Woeseiaceae bacterium]
MYFKTTNALSVALACTGIAIAPTSVAEELADESIEEVITFGRLKSGAAALTDERMEVPFSADYLGFEAISRAGDSNIAAALRRVPGLTVIDGKFVYVRGLGERYSSVQVNGAAVPSPDLTRSVIPLDLFPTSIVEAIKIQKAPSPDQPAAFGGGSVNIRTKSVPDELVASLSVSTGFNSEGDSAGLQFNHGSSRLPAAIDTAINTYRGDISVTNIFNTMSFEGDASLAEARGIHQGLIDSLNTDVAASYRDNTPDFGGRLSLGNSWYLGDNEALRVGVLLDGSYNESFRNEDQRREAIGNPETQFVEIDRTIYEERTVASLNLGVDWLADHTLGTSFYQLVNDEARADFTRGFDQNNLQEDGDQKLSYRTRFESRELQLFQLSGNHTFIETPVATRALNAFGLANLEFDWYWSDSTATTELPNSTDFSGSAVLNEDGQEVSRQLLASTSMGIFSFLELDDDLSSWGGNLSLPIEAGHAALTVSGGWWGSKKTREYYGYNVNLNAVGIGSGLLGGGPADVLNEDRLTVENGFNLSLGSNFGTESYIAAQKVDAFYGMVDVELTEWRFSGGVRYEDYQQAILPVDLLDFSGNSVRQINERLADPDQRLAIREDDTFLSLAVTYMGSGLFAADDYQFRLSYGETVVRPDLREISDVVYIDPELSIRVAGNELLLTSPIDNFEARGEFYYSNGDNFTVSLFHKEIENPIERIRTAGSDDNIQLTFTNAESGEVYGVEMEGLKTIGVTGFFVSGNVTLSDSNLKIDTAGITGAPTNSERRLTGHSRFVANATLGFDAESGRHSAFVNYNVFGERVFYGGISGNDDAFEQPFHSLGIVYKWFPTDYVEVDVGIDNLLDEKNRFEQLNLAGQEAVLIDQRVGRTFGIGAKLLF